MKCDMAAQAAKDYFYTQILWNIFMGFYSAPTGPQTTDQVNWEANKGEPSPTKEPKKIVLQCLFAISTSI